MRIDDASRRALVCLFLAFLTTALFAGEVRRAAEPVAGRYVVELRDGTADVPALAAQLAAKYDGKVLAVWSHALKGFYLQLSAANADRLAHDVRVRTVEEDALVHPSSSGAQATGTRQTIIPQLPGADPADDPLWHLTRISHRDHQTANPHPPADLDYFTYFYANDGTATDGRQTTVYVIDVGVLAAHLEFAQNTRPQGSRPAIEPGSNRAATPDYDNGIPPDFVVRDTAPATNPCNGALTDASGMAHGTAVASLIVGKNLGVAKGAVVVPVVMLSCGNGPGDVSQTTAALLLSALDWVAQDVGNPAQKLAVLSMSTFRSVQSQSHARIDCADLSAVCDGMNDTTILEEALTRIVDSGVPVVVSANNQAADACRATPARLSRRGGRTVFGRRTRVITVGGTERDDQRWNRPVDLLTLGSNYGQCVDIWAPGAELRIASTNKDGQGKYTRYKDLDQSGTSYSAPIVAGVVARMLAEDPSLAASPLATADLVWDRLQRNATRLAPGSMGAGSPSLLVYLGAADFIEQPKAVTASSGSNVTLSVQMKETTGLTYQWYRGIAGDTRSEISGATSSSYTFTICATDAMCDQTIDPNPEKGQDFWVRVKRAGAPGFADSNAARVRLGSSCPSLPVIIEQPASVWVPEQGTNGAVTLQAKVRSDVVFCYQWQLIGAPAAQQPAVVIAQPPTSQTTLTFSVPASSAGLRHYRLVLWPTGSCGESELTSSCVTASDTAQIRLCVPPTGGNFGVTSREYDTTVENLREALHAPISGEDVRYRWLRAPLGGGEPTVPLRIELPGGEWRTFRDVDLRPPLPGIYAVEGANSCGIVKSGSITVTRVRDYDVNVRVEGAIVYRRDQLPSAPPFVGPCFRRARIFIEIVSAGSVPRRPTFAWSLLPGDQRETKDVADDTLLTAPLTGNRDVTVTVHDSATSTDYTLTIHLGTSPTVCTTECLTRSTNFAAMAGQCTLTADPVYNHDRGGVVDIAPTLWDLTTGNRINPGNDYKYLWMIVNADGTKTVFADTLELPRPVGTEIEHLELLVRHGSECTVMPVQIRPKTTSCNQCKYRCKIRAVPHVNGVPTEIMTVSSGQQLVLSPPEVEAGATYEWHRITSAAGDVAFSTSPEVTDAPTVTTTYYFRELTAENEIDTSANAYIGVDGAGDHTSVAQPPIQIVGPGATVTLTAFIPNVDRVPSMHYEWRRGNNHDPNTPVLGTDALLTLYDPPDDASYWCRIIKDGINYDSNIATVIVNCGTVHGTIMSTPANRRVGRNETPQLEAHGIGKLLMYRWERNLPGETVGTFAGIGPAIRPYVTAPVTYFTANVEDACGTTGSFGTVPVYLCIPSITTHPQGRTVTPGTPVTMTVAATPAIDGQTLEYEWYRSSDLTRANRLQLGMSYTTALPAGTISDSFYVAVKSMCDSDPQYTNSYPAIIDVCDYPAVTPNTPGSLTGQGQQALVSVSVSGRGTIDYQWYRGASGVTTNPLEGETNSYITVAPAATTSYWCRVTADGTCSTDGPAITVPVCSTPAIQTQPASMVIFSGTSATLTVVGNAGTNTSPLAYQWYQQSGGGAWTAVGGATAAAYTTPALTSATSFRVEVSAGACKVTSGTAVMSMCTYPEVVNAAPAETQTTVGQSVTLQLPVISPVYDKIVRWFEGESGVRSSPTAGGYLNAPLTVSPSTTKKYWAEFEHNGCVSRTTTYTINVCLPTITSQPQGSSVTSGTAVTLTAGTTSLAGQTFQWYAGPSGTTTSPITGATSASLTITPNVTTTYWVRVTGTCGQWADSDAATINVCVPPAIGAFTGPAVDISSGQSAILSVTATGTNLSYQWYSGALGVTTNPIANSNWNNITVTPAVTTSYWVKVTSIGLCSTNTSRVVTVNVCQTPSFSVQPQSQRSFAGKSLTLSAAASSATGPVTYQWYQGASGTTTSPINGATSATVTVAPAAQASYWVRATNAICTADSATATISMCTYPEVVNASPVDTNIGYGESVTLALPVVSPVRDKTVTWYRGASGDRTTVVGSPALNRSYTTPALTATTQYWAEFDEGGCVSRTTTYNVRVCIPAITTHPAGATIPAGQNRVLTAGTTAIAGQTFQWYTGSSGTTTNPVSGATSASVTVTPAATTTYWVRVTGTCGQWADSNAATVTVCNTPSISSISPTLYVQSGQQAAINVTATGGNLSYQWYAGATGVTTNPVPNGTAATIAVVPATNTTYWCRILSEGLCPKDSTAVLVDVCTTPSITQPQSTMVRTGSPATLTVSTSATGATYQWYTGASGTTSSPITGATSATLTVTPANDTQYWVRVSRGACRADSNTVTVTVCKITASIANVNSASGQPVTLTAGVTNARAGVTYTWYRGSTGDTSAPLGGGLNVYQMGVSPAATTDYWVRVSDGTCPYDSPAGRVNVCIPAITAQPQSLIIANGQSTTLSVTATGAPLTYQWYIGDAGVTSNPIAGATAQTYTTPALTTLTKYWVRVTGCTNADSDTAVVTVCIPPSINGALTISTSRSIGNPATITVNAGGTNPTFQWYTGSSGDTSHSIGGATGATLNFTLSQSEYYWVRVSGCGTSVNSPSVLYSVNPTITTQPVSAAVPRNTTATLTVAATGTYLSYQWYQGSPGVMTTPMNGATSYQFVTPPVTASTTYWCKVTSGTDGLAYSNGATASVCTGPSAGFTAQYIGGNSWMLSANVAQADLGRVKYQFYIGTPGNVAQSTPYGDNGPTYYRSIYGVTEPQTWWVRITYNDGSCYSNTGGQMIFPVE